MTRPLTPDEKKQLRLFVDGGAAATRVAWTAFMLMMLWRLSLFVLGQGSGIGELTFLMLTGVIPITIAHFTSNLSGPYKRDLKGNVAAGVSAPISAVDELNITVRGERFEVSQKIASQLNVGDQVAIEFTPHSRTVLQIHRISGSEGPELIGGGQTVETN